MALAIICWFKVDYCFTIVSYDGLLRWWLQPAALFNRTNMIHMTTSVIKYIAYNVQDYIVLYNNTVSLVGILLTCGKHLHDRIISSVDFW